MKGMVAGSLMLAAAWLQLPAAVERWLHNPRERTARAHEALTDERVDDAAELFDAAGRIAPDDPLVRFNAGTGALLAGRDDAAGELQAATTLAPPKLAPRALYNLGNAQLSQGEAAAAVEAFKSSLRLDPGQLDAKHNLELALRALEQQSGRGEEQETPDADDQGEQESSDSPGGETPPDDSEPSEDGADTPPEQRPQEGDREQPGDDPRDRPLPDFEQQEDMTAEQAAAILEAVENLEREQRRQEASERLKARRKGDRDW